MNLDSTESAQSETLIDFDEAIRMRHDLDHLEDEITRTAGHINAIDYHFIKLLADFDEKQGWVGTGIKSFAHWLNWKCGLGQLEAREKVRVARCLRTLPLIDEAFRCGEISYSKVRAITRVANPRNEDCLLYIARNGTAQHVELAVRRYKHCRSLDGNVAMLHEKGFSYFQDQDGMYVFHGRLPAEEGAVVAQAIDKMLDQLREAKYEASKTASEVNEGGVETAGSTGSVGSAGSAGSAGNAGNAGNVESADTAGDAENKANVVSEKNGETGNGTEKEKNGGIVSAVTFTAYDSKPDFQTDRASALVAVAEHFLATTKDGARVLDGSDQYHVILHINANPTHIDHRIAGGPACYLETGCECRSKSAVICR